jgi:hypothetical protein
MRDLSLSGPYREKDVLGAMGVKQIELSKPSPSYLSMMTRRRR